MRPAASKWDARSREAYAEDRARFVQTVAADLEIRREVALEAKQALMRYAELRQHAIGPADRENLVQTLGLLAAEAAGS